MADIVIRGVNTLTQGDDVIYNFTCRARELIDLCRVERFGEDANGVNRKYDERHALKIADAMLDRSVLWPEPILGDMAGGWEFDARRRILTAPEGAYVSIDDGQHRFMALQVLNEAERDRLEFTVQVTIGLSYERRLRVFRRQGERKRIDARLDLAQRHRLGDWKQAVDGEAYELLLLLNSSTTSPLRGAILLDEQQKRPYEGRHRPVGINAKGLHSTLRSVLGGKSPLQALSQEQRTRVVCDMIQLAAETWPNAWNSDQHALTTARGINAVLGLLVSSPNFRGTIGDDFRRESLKVAMNHAKTFKWNTGALKNTGVREIINRLDQAIGRNKLKSVA